MNKDLIFIEQHKQMCGEQGAKQMLETLKKKESAKKADEHTSVYLNVYGEEVHVNGPVAVPLVPYETLQQKIARFEALSASVAANRSLLYELKSAFEDGDEETEEEAEKAMEEVETVDEFGDPITVGSRSLFVEKETNVEDANEKAAAPKATAAEIASDEALVDDVKDVDK